MTEWSQYEIDQLIEASKGSEEQAKKTVDLLESLTTIFQNTHTEITGMRKEMAALKQEIRHLKDPKKTAIPFPVKKP